jgi:hypothetical protein
MNPRSMGAALAASALALVPCTLFAQAPPTPKPAAEMAQIKMFDGSWSCAGDIPAGPMGPAQKTKTTVKVHTDMGGFWQTGTVSMSSAAMPSFQGQFHTTYDPGKKQYVMLWVDNMGGYSQETAPGWDGDKLVYTGDGSMGGQKMQTRDTFVKAADGSFKRSGDMQVNGQWVSMGEETCHHAMAAAAAPKK